MWLGVSREASTNQPSAMRMLSKGIVPGMAVEGDVPERVLHSLFCLVCWKDWILVLERTTVPLFKSQLLIHVLRNHRLGHLTSKTQLVKGPIDQDLSG